VKELLDKFTPQFHICGHHHTRVDWTDGETEVSVLGRDTQEADSVLILDLVTGDDEVTTGEFSFQGEKFNDLLESFVK
jgi:Icc-related predicted phosphoesterase